MNSNIVKRRSIISWINASPGIKNEKGDKIDFVNHPFLYDIFRDQSQNLTVMKAAQVGMSTTSILKNHHDARQYKMDIIYTLPTDKDVSVFVGGKVNRIIANNESMLKDVADKDSIEQKQVGRSMIYFRGTWTKKAAIMVTADRLVHDEKDSSKLDIIADYQARTQHSKFKQTHTFSHPSLPETGVHADWIKSDQKHWFITCSHCKHEQYLSWDTENPKKMSVDIEKEIYICKKCHGEIYNVDRQMGRWIAKYLNRPISGYWVSMLMAPWVSAKEIVAKFRDPETTPEFFYQKILGLPYADGSSKLLRNSFFQNLTGKIWAPDIKERIVMGIDTGLRLDYVLGNTKGLFFQGDCTDYKALDDIMTRWTRCVSFIDAGGDLIGSRAFAERWPGRVFLVYFVGDRNQEEIFTFGKGDDHRSVKVDRNRGIQLTVDEFRNKRIAVHGTQEDWYEYWLDWNNLAKLKVLDSETNQVKGYKWIRSGRDHRALATICWRAGMSRFAGMGNIIMPNEEIKPNSYELNPDNTVSLDPKKMFDKQFDDMEAEDDDWRL